MSWQVPSPHWTKLNPGTTRICTKCGEAKPATPDFFWQYNRNGIGLKSVCIECDKSRQNIPKYRKLKSANKYGITLDEYEQMSLNQDDKCAICGIGQYENGRILAIDHDHETESIRGLLCIKCNLMLGFAKDSIDVLKNAVEYLQSEQENIKEQVNL